MGAGRRTVGSSPFAGWLRRTTSFYAHDGFWACMDTFKEMQELEDLYGRGNAPWTVWNGHCHEPPFTSVTRSRVCTGNCVPETP